ncbi:hypothetical protein LK514_05770 [Faecalicatena fissicatena]|nr:hypothetical protein [Faecalicatena fissicatena]
MDNTTIQKFLDEHDYDIRKTHNGRWIDQKCTMDVVCLVSDCIVEYTSNREDKKHLWMIQKNISIMRMIKVRMMRVDMIL